MKIKTWDSHSINDGTNYTSIVYSDTYGLPAVTPGLVAREGTWPIFAGLTRPGKRVFLDIVIRGTSVSTLQEQLNLWFDPDDETPKALVVEDDAGGNDRYVMAICERLSTIADSYGTEWVATLQISGDPMWRETTATAPTAWSVTATGQTHAFTNSGEMNCYPTIKIKPTTAKSSGDYPYKRWVPVLWRSEDSAADYPVDIADDSLDTRTASTNFKLTNGDDLRVLVDGVEVDRWLDGPNTATTKVWVNLDFAATDKDMRFAVAVDSDDTSMTVDVDIGFMPSTGILYVGSEAIAYTSKSNAFKTFYGCTRGIRGTTAASHAVGDYLSWVQHDIWIIYGNSGAGTAPADANTKPMFELASSDNESWDYNDFNDVNGTWPNIHPRAARWLISSWDTVNQTYTATQDTSGDPQSVTGCKFYQSGYTQYYLINPCRITNANFQNGYIRRNSYREPLVGGIVLQHLIKSEYGTEYEIPSPGSADTWTAWSDNEAMTSGAKKVALELYCNGITGAQVELEASDITLTLDSNYTPLAYVLAEQGNYTLACTITNTTHPDDLAIEINFTMKLNEELEINTDEKTVIHLVDNSNQFQALTLAGGPRRDWLPLIPGSNTLQFDDTGTVAVTVTLTYEERAYQ